MRARLGRDVTLTLVISLVLSRLDYCNSVRSLLGFLPQYWRRYRESFMQLLD